jgi:hypothetical protein
MKQRPPKALNFPRTKRIRAMKIWRRLAASLPNTPRRRYSPLVALGDRLQFADIFVPECKQTFVHLAQAVQEYRNIDFLIVILIFEGLEPSVEESVFYAVNQIRNNPFQPESKSLFALIRKPVIKPNNLSDLVNVTFPQIFIDETISDAIDWLRVDANDLLTNIPIAHLIPHHRSGYTCEKIPDFSSFNIRA